MKPEKIGAALFDLDGTLIDSLEDIAAAANQTLERFGVAPHPVGLYRQFVGNGLTVLMRRIMPAGTPAEIIERGAATFKVLYQENWNRSTTPYPGITGMLKKCVGAGIKVAVLSNKPDEFTRMCATHFFSDCPFAIVRGQRDGVPGKPHPQAALEIAEDLGIAPRACLFVGDSAVDIETGRSAGMYSVGVTWGFRDRQELADAGADLIISKPDELINHALATA